MNIRKFSLPIITPPFKQVLGRLGYNYKKAKVDQDILDNIKHIIQETQDLIHPVGVSLDVSILEKTEVSITLDHNIILPSQKIAKLLANCTKATLLACTIGDELGAMSKTLMHQEQLTNSVIYDAIASEAVEAMADYITGVLVNEMTLMRFKPTMRYSPGYGDLPTSMHKSILPLLQSNDIGISYDPQSYILSPEKSITAIIGWW